MGTGIDYFDLFLYLTDAVHQPAMFVSTSFCENVDPEKIGPDHCSHTIGWSALAYTVI